MDKKHVRLSLDVSHELNNLLDDMAKKTHGSKSDVLRKAIALMTLAIQEREKGHHLGVFKNQKMLKEIVGL